MRVDAHTAQALERIPSLTLRARLQYGDLLMVLRRAYCSGYGQGLLRRAADFLQTAVIGGQDVAAGQEALEAA